MKRKTYRYDSPQLPLQEPYKMIAEMLADGYTFKDITVKSGEGKGWINAHTQALRKKFGARNTPHLIAILLRREILK